MLLGMEYKVVQPLWKTGTIVYFKRECYTLKWFKW